MTNRGNRIGICECCFEETQLTRHHILARTFCKRMPQKLYFQEVAPINFANLCRDCHNRIEKRVDTWRIKLARQFDIDPFDELELERVKKIRTMSRALVHYRHNIPRDRKEQLFVELEELVQQKLTANFLRKLTQAKYKSSDSLSKQIASKIRSPEEWLRFRDLWIDHYFIFLGDIQRQITEEILQ
jgi:hypothetical protein